MTDRNLPQDPLVERYASRRMLELFSAERRIRQWRAVWIALAEAQAQLGLPITRAQIAQMRRAAPRVNWKVAERIERRIRHDVMAHVKAFAVQCPKAAPIIHLGATSALVTDNADLVIMREGLEVLLGRTLAAIGRLSRFARRHKDAPTMSYTHLQPATPTTVGKRACLWLQDLVMDAQELERRLAGLRALGAKGATGTQETFVELFGGNKNKARRLDKIFAAKLGFKQVLGVSGQTYTRKIDHQILAALSGVAQSAAKFGNDVRLLQGFGEMSEGFGAEQVGSSAMPYKRNPMKSERLVSLARYVMNLEASAAATAAAQWLERTLDDSAVRRLTIPGAFLATDAVLVLYADVVSGLEVAEGKIAARLAENLPFMAAEAILMAAAKSGADRQDLHERLRVHSQGAWTRMRAGGGNDLVERLKADPSFKGARKLLAKPLEPERFTGRAAEQVEEFISGTVEPLLARRRKLILEPQRVRI